MACTPYQLSAITTACGANVPSIKSIWVGAFGSAVIKHDLVSSTATDYADVDLLDDGNTENPQLIVDDGKHIIVDIKSAALDANADKWVEFAFRKNTCSASSEMTINDNGTFYWTNTLNMLFSKQDSAKRLAIQALASGDCSAIYQDGNGNYWFIGLDDPVNLSSASATTGTAVGDNNQYELAMSEEAAVMPIPLKADQAKTIIAALTE